MRILLALCVVLIPLCVQGAGIGGAMTERSILWQTNGVGDGAACYTMDDMITWQQMMWLKDRTAQGVAKNYENELEVTNPAGLTLRVATGGATVYGFPYWSTANVDHALVAPIINTTGWRLVLRADWAAQTVRSVLLQSADGVAAAPGVTQNPGVTWEISLAHGTVTVPGVVAITDDRDWIEPNVEIMYDEIENRTRNVFVPCTGVRNVTDGTEELRTAQMHGYRMQDAKVSQGYADFYVPADFASAMSVTGVFVCAAAVGNLYLRIIVDYGAVGEAFDNHAAVWGYAAIAEAGLFILAETTVLNLPLLTAGDHLTLSFARGGTDVLDTSTSNIYFKGFIIRYTADS